MKNHMHCWGPGTDMQVERKGGLLLECKGRIYTDIWNLQTLLLSVLWALLWPLRNGKIFMPVCLSL